MTVEELVEIVEQGMNAPPVLGRLACNLRSDKDVAQRHYDKTNIDVVWRNTGAFWRCTLFLDEETELCLAQIDLHNDGTVRVESFEPCSITIAPDDGILCLTRYKPK